MTEPFTHTTIHTNGINLHVVQAGPENGPLVILLHGFPEYWRGWAKQIGPLADAGLRVWVPDQRGYNLSDKPRGLSAYRIDTLAKDVLGLIEASGSEKACLAGHDWGAAVAWWTALRYPEKLRRLAILNVPHPAVRSLKGSSRRETFNDEDIQHYRRAWGQKDAFSSMLNWYRAIVQRLPKIPAGLRIHVPTLMLWGVRDMFLGRELAQPSLDLCDEGKLVFFEQATHWVQHEEAEKVNARLIDFFESRRQI